MGHRHLVGSSQMLDDEHDQGWSHVHTEQHYANLARSGTNDSRSYVYPVENMASEGLPFSSHWNSSPRPNGYMSSGHGLERPHYNSEASGPSHDPLLTSSTVASFTAPPENYVPYASSSNYNSQTWPNGNCVDLSMANVRGAQKRKSPCASSICERGSSSQDNGDRSSSDIPLPSELHMEKPIIGPHYMPWDHLPMDPSYRSNGLLIRGEGSSRNVRSRPAFDLETSLARNHLPNNPGLGSHSTAHFIDHSVSGDFPAQTSQAVSREWNCSRLSPAPREINGFCPETNNFLPGRSVTNNAPIETSGFHHGITNRHSIVPQNFPGTSTQSASSGRGSYSHRSIPTYRASSSGLRLGHIAPPDERSHLVTETYPSRHLRPLPHVSWRSSDRSGRRRSSYERFHQPHFDESTLHDRFSSEGFMVVDRAGYYASGNIFDQHRDMRLDIDNMTYEELLALGERIGSVNTGLSNNAIDKCLEETTYLSSHQTEEQRLCVICLEEYKEREEIGRLKGCGHDYHGSCVKKWLSMKNSCPICKASAIPDHLKNQ
ncbi:PREDICTED: probable E3 ubiquitin-protein ligase HIP1 [Tarenaya hassleriana]|uniref:probable E3 ubiquitin-protein ligase HIP1 n=1 Tax=Tarenaya hassleriana TaxID=28532 RepID=UPI00053C2961|nr:PREDICTED: probable E3 ubiquitin-protein ligase HIP1 [Tarenaya hassleriana]XP_010529738.1 PREDICTED: probable E3 ubiquitin-protein ligase HIP1 [Tarenaya hassleriana]XP_010529739.1 PREDICTED: probable E3 ubiquitin-protein ligase HIP1 [Tarenaya hassleriana]XP_010529740.1 PREDICTED: probable E3 ubiquitin-protein ligase HIP1 [Tarenaya hassleriana]XP_010529741.1 PREDICTED: probable E3 ubiquitin-protein ligase HIP1 [Tarenaya hassleriana]XP_019057253.1 PREDICTED: probable E3 ubiquitin-protein liga